MGLKNLLFGKTKPKNDNPPPSKGKGPNAKVSQSQLSQVIGAGMVDIKDIIAPPAIEIDFDFIKIGNLYYRSLFVSGYPRFVGANWLSPIINFDHTLDISFFYYPVEPKGVLNDLKRKIAEMEATIDSDLQRGKVVNPAVRVALDDAQELQDQLVKGTERFFQFSFYVTIPAETLEELNEVSSEVESTLGALLVLTKHATLQMEQGFISTLPLATDKLMVIRNMDTTSLATTFPFVSSELTANEGILYGINEHNGSLVIFDRFTLENANTVIFAKSGSGKSYLTKLEALRTLMFGAEIIIIDPEAEYKTLCEAIGGEFISFAQSAPAKLNPFDLAGVYEEGENELGLKILTLHSLLRVMLGELTPSEDAVLDRALVATYRSKGITPEPSTQNLEPPLMEDLYKILLGMIEPEAKNLNDRLEKYIKGSMRGIFDQRTTVNLKNTFTVFSIRDLEDSLRPTAMFIILDYIWTRVRKDRRKRLLIVDEAWYLMKYPDSATFLYSMAKRARKYYLGVTTVTQDVEDFLSSDYGKAIVTNSSIQILMKQSAAAIDKIAEVFYLSEGEKHLLLSSDIGEGLFFAGSNHVAIKVQASPEEHLLITSNPAELAKMGAEAKELAEIKQLDLKTKINNPEAAQERPTATNQGTTAATTVANPNAPNQKAPNNASALAQPVPTASASEEPPAARLTPNRFNDIVNPQNTPAPNQANPAPVPPPTEPR